MSEKNSRQDLLLALVVKGAEAHPGAVGRSCALELAGFAPGSPLIDKGLIDLASKIIPESNSAWAGGVMDGWDRVRRSDHYMSGYATWNNTGRARGGADGTAQDYEDGLVAGEMAFKLITERFT